MDYAEIQTMISRRGDDAKVALATTNGLTLRERFRRTMSFQEVDRRPNFEFGYWDRTLQVWHRQGLPEHVVDEASAYEYFGIESWHMIGAHSNPVPRFEASVYEVRGDYYVFRDQLGCIAQINKFGDQSIPHFIDFPVKDRASWMPYLELLEVDRPERWTGFEESIATAKETDKPVGVYGGSLLGVPRNLMGFERIATMAYEDPDFLAHIVDAFGSCAVGVLERVLSRVEVDFCMGWEDICFNMGPIVPPEFMRAVAGPWYRRIADLLAAHGCTVYTSDTDGNILPIIDTFLDNGLTTMFPVEVHAGTDPCMIRAKYGKRVKLWGGVCKLKLAESRAAIDAELDRLRPCVEEGGFIPGVDHRVPADVPLANYLYYLDRKREVLGVGGEPKYA
ncbi:MAG: hypothetical protein K1Y02_08615 [Candidatus Hydrogenedentes bacterium]|nr:hypothetical protein [Candidatus Hydrogenedentota bacterium]